MTPTRANVKLTRSVARLCAIDPFQHSFAVLRDLVFQGVYALRKLFSSLVKAFHLFVACFDSLLHVGVGHLFTDSIHLVEGDDCILYCHLLRRKQGSQRVRIFMKTLGRLLCVRKAIGLVGGAHVRKKLPYLRDVVAHIGSK